MNEDIVSLTVVVIMGILTPFQGCKFFRQLPDFWAFMKPEFFHINLFSACFFFGGGIHTLFSGFSGISFLVSLSLHFAHIGIGN